MPTHTLTDLIVTLLHVVAGSHRHRRRGRPEASATVARRLLIQIHHRLRPVTVGAAPVLFPDRPMNRPLLSDPDAHQRVVRAGVLLFNPVVDNI
jgi:hypothetical protein